MEYVVYILYSLKNGRNYVGMTGNLIGRMKSHNELGKDSTRHHRPWIVVHVEFYGSKEEAMKREKYLKRGRGVEEKRRIIEEFKKKFVGLIPFPT